MIHSCGSIRCPRRGPKPPPGPPRRRWRITRPSSLRDLSQRLIERTEGNPFLIEERVRSLVETQVLTGEPSAYYLATPVPHLQVPATVQAVLAARIDCLPAEEKRLLQTAAVIGDDPSYSRWRS